MSPFYRRTYRPIGKSVSLVLGELFYTLYNEITFVNDINCETSL